MADEPQTVVRAFELPLQHCEPEVWPLLRECWKQATMLANWCAHKLARCDVCRTPTMTKLPPMPKINLYAEAKRACPGWSFFAGACISASTICRNVESHYRRERYKVTWRSEQALRTYRYPYPWPVHAQSWSSAWLDVSGKPNVRLALPGGQVELRLRGGPEFGRQMGLFRKVVAEDLPRKQLVIREQNCSAGCHRPYMTEKTAGGGQARHSRVMVKMVAELPVLERPGERVLTLVTDPQAFWVAELDGRQAWVLNADHVKRACDWIAVHEDRLMRLAQDTKAERRLKTGRLLQLNEFRKKRCDKHHRRMSSWLHETAAHLVGYAVRQKVGLVVYDDREQGFIYRFPWHRLKVLLGDKLMYAGIEMLCKSEEVAGNVVSV